MHGWISGISVSDVQSYIQMISPIYSICISPFIVLSKFLFLNRLVLAIECISYFGTFEAFRLMKVNISYICVFDL